MVTFYVISEYSSTLPTKGGGEKIAGGPLYDLNRVKSITKDRTGLLLWTKDCAKDVQELIKQLFFCKFHELVLRRCAHAAGQGFIVR